MNFDRPAEMKKFLRVLTRGRSHKATKWGHFDHAPEGEKTGYILEITFIETAKLPPSTRSVIPTSEYGMTVSQIIRGAPVPRSLCATWNPAGTLVGIFEVYTTFADTLDIRNYTIDSSRSRLLFPNSDQKTQKDGVVDLHSILRCFRQPSDRTLLTSSAIAESLLVPF